MISLTYWTSCSRSEGEALGNSMFESSRYIRARISLTSSTKLLIKSNERIVSQVGVERTDSDSHVCLKVLIILGEIRRSVLLA